MVAFRSLHAARRSRLRGRRPKRTQPGAAEPQPVAITRATVIGTDAFADAGEAAAWLRACRDGERAEHELDRALESVNHAVAAHRVAALDPYARDLVRADVQRARLGFGTGDEVVESRWHDALVVPPERPRRRSRRRMLSPQEEMAGMLSGRRPSGWPSEELLLRARLDLDHGRLVEAALGARAAAAAMAAELAAAGGGEAGGPHAALEALADSALTGGLSADQAEELAEAVTELERAARRRRYSGRR